jgi:L-lactate dehydrogenase complex protein LldE
VRVALFVACFNDVLVPSTGVATVKLLRRLGVDVDFPQEQACCGQVHYNSGYPGAAVPMVRRFATVFAGYDAVVAPTASCVGTVHEQHPRLARSIGDADLVEAVDVVRHKTYELATFLTDVLGVEDVGAYYPHRVTYHPTCHSLRGLRVGDRPLRLLRQVRALDLVPLPNAEECCGFGGTFAVKNADVSGAMLADKIATIEATGASRCTALDNSCLLHIGGGLRRGHAARTVHLAEILASTEADA